MPTPTKYKYSISGDFPNHIAATDRLEQETRLSTIVTAIDHINTSGDDCDFWFKDVLSVEDQAILNNVVAEHLGVPLPSGSLLVRDDSPRSPDDIILTISEPRRGSEVIYATHNFCDPVSWFGDSARSVDETLIDSGDGYSFTSSHINWIDMISGRVLDDDGLVEEQKQLNPSDPHGYKVIVNVDGYEKEMRVPFENDGGDYEVYWDDGYVKFYESQAGKTVTASYSYASGSTFYIKPLPGTILNIEAAEADFSSGLIQNDTIQYSVWGYVDVFAPQYLISNGGPYPPGTKIPIKTGYYKRYTQILREAIGAYPTLSPNAADPMHYNLSDKEFRRVSRGSRTETQSTPFRYATTRDLMSAYGMELRVNLIHDREFSGESATITFYCTSKVGS